MKTLYKELTFVRNAIYDVLCPTIVSPANPTEELRLSNLRDAWDTLGTILDQIPAPYDPAFGDERLCRCLHPYRRHFDTYMDMEPVGCKYCVHTNEHKPETNKAPGECAGFSPLHCGKCDSSIMENRWVAEAHKVFQNHKLQQTITIELPRIACTTCGHWKYEDRAMAIKKRELDRARQEIVAAKERHG